jgi:hypothetical protein
MDAEAADNLLQRLAEVRAQMLPALKRNSQSPRLRARDGASQLSDGERPQGQYTSRTGGCSCGAVVIR